jgi:hypothetical protein
MQVSKPVGPPYGVTVSGALFRTPNAAALIDTPVLAVTRDVRTGNDRDVAPAGTVTLATVGAATALLLLDSDTTMPPDGAAHSSVKLAVAVVPPLAGLGERTSVFTRIGRTVTARDFEVPP